MLQKNNAHPSQAEMSATKDTRNSTGSTIKLTPRQHRALVNFAELCASLRRKLGYDAIDTGTIEGAVDRDGQPCKPGYYALSPQGRERAVALLGVAHHA